jgi:superfamily II DNA or RNA helicase
MKLTITNTIVTADGTRDELVWLDRCLSFPDRRWQARSGDGKLHLLTQERTFPTGLLPRVRRFALKHARAIELVDARVVPCTPDPTADIEWLRHHPQVTAPITHQVAAVAAVVKYKRGVLWIPTGGGKTEVAIGLTLILPCRWLFFVHRAGLLRQTAARYHDRTGLDAGIVGDADWDVPDGCQFVVATYQTLAAKLRRGDTRAQAVLDSAQAVVFDEAHTLPADQFFRVAMGTPNAYYRVAMSGTPLARTDRRAVYTVACTGPVIYRVPTPTLMDLGILSRPNIRMCTVVQKGDPRRHDFYGDGPTGEPTTYQGVYGHYVVRSAVRNKALVKDATEIPKPALLFVKELAHGRALTERLTKAGVRTEFVWGSHGTATREAAIKRLVRNDVDVIVCSVIFQEGIDIPSLAGVVVGSGGASVIAAIQRVGRGSRRAEGKTTFEVRDIFDAGHPWLERHAKARRKAYLAEGYEVSVVGP